MKSIDSQDHYEILEVSMKAGQEELNRAYRIAHAAFENESLASYSIFEEVDADVIREKIELAYRVLSDPEQRRGYDLSIGHAAPAAGEPVAPDFVEAPAERIRRGELAVSVEAFEDLEAEEEEQEGFDGPRLRRARLRRGIDIGEIAIVTKISSTYLQHLEEGRFDQLPARVYVRGFVSAYARALGLDSERVASTYMGYFDESVCAPPRGRPADL